MQHDMNCSAHSAGLVHMEFKLHYINNTCYLACNYLLKDMCHSLKLTTNQTIRARRSTSRKLPLGMLRGGVAVQVRVAMRDIESKLVRRGRMR